MLKNSILLLEQSGLLAVGQQVDESLVTSGEDDASLVREGMGIDAPPGCVGHPHPDRRLAEGSGRIHPI